ncbi:hypothetical protein FS749_002150 [Ceratobasidium sp. UAMH 11750]|nr:hypothetical protein FS749_002150 [Ceratobasidium sp. UAMH 11750]
MPRRPAPSALHLATGPMPARGEPRHTLPAPPQPVFQPKTITKPRSDSLSSLNQRNPSTLAPSLPGFMGADPTDKSSVDGIMFEPTHDRGYTPHWDARPTAISTTSRKVQPGPWDRTRSNTLPQERIAELITLPKPVVANPAPVW